ncbi:MAG: phosphoribosylglycinamide formyltransferase [Acidobacteriota bacterium]|nr:phosphoribosylglycinamide formyltransferase [Acidobacteriota bacterium]
MKRLGILLSGRGSNFVALADAHLDAAIAIVVSNRPEAPGIAIARDRGFNALVLPSRGVDRETYDAQLAAALDAANVDLICLAGYMRLLSPAFIHRYPQRILNIHPSLLPAFPGLHAHRDALAHGAKISGCTVHFVDEGLDSGPIIQQAAVPVLDNDTEETLAASVLKEEHRIYRQAVARVLSGKFRIEGRRVIEL